MPKVLNKRNGIPRGAVYVGRPTKWGNPFKIGHDDRGTYWSRDDVVDLHKKWLQTNNPYTVEELEELRGKDLVCWCAPQPCHADALIELANQVEDKPVC